MPPLIDIESLLEPVSDIDPGGPNLEYAAEFLELERALNIAVAERPGRVNEWRRIRHSAEILFRSTKDLRVAIVLLRALVASEGWVGLRDGLTFIGGLLDRYWVTMHPRLDSEADNDPTWRLNILGELGNPDGLIRDLYAVQLVSGGRGQTVSLADVDRAFGTGKEKMSEGSSCIEIEVAFRAADERQVREVLQVLRDAAEHLVRIEALLFIRTGRSTDGMRARLANTLEHAMRQLEGGLKRCDLVFNLAEAPSNLTADLKFESMADFEPEKIAEGVPALKQLLEARRSLNEMLKDRGGSGDAAAPASSLDDMEDGVPEPIAPPGDTLPSVSIPEECDRTAESDPPRDELARVVDENVQFTVYRPRSIIAERWYTLLAFAHLAEPRDDAPIDDPAPIEEVHRQAISMLGEEAAEYQALTDDSIEAIPEHSQLTLVPYVPGIEFNPAIRSFRWTEAVHRESFRMRAGATLAGKRARGHLYVFLGSILIGEVSLSFRVEAAWQSRHEREPVESSWARLYRKIFPSYAHGDAAIVEQFERFAESLGDAYLRDVTTLRAGEVWDERLEELIAYADVFQLFWSTRSMVSLFVRREWERALSLERPHFIRPVYWEDPLPKRTADGLPPPTLSRLHFQYIPWALSAVTSGAKEQPITKGEPLPSTAQQEDERIQRAVEEQRLEAERPESLQHKLSRVRPPRVQITYEIETSGAEARVQLPFIMGVLADLAGNPKEPLPEVPVRKFIEIDMDNFEEVMKSFKPRVAFVVPNTLRGEGELRVDLTFENIDDFSPGVVARKILASQQALESRELLFAQINLILHHEDFQKLEGAWRGLYYLVSNTETDERLKIRVLNISKAELAATLKRFKGAAWDQSPIFKKLYDEVYGQFGGEPYGCLVADYYFDHSPPDVELLGEMGKIGSAIHAPFITGASPKTMHMDSWQELNNPRDLLEIFQAPEFAAWRFLRDSEESRYIGLTLPRFLARLPYGARTNPVNEFDFEEDADGADLSKYTWAQ